jgi:hypothetical protein
MRWVGSHWKAVAVGAGLLMGGLGVTLSLRGGDVAVFGDAAGLHVGSSLLPLQPLRSTPTERVYSGDAAMVLSSISDDHVDASAVTTVSGTRSAGFCEMHQSGQAASEVCRFTVGGASFTSRDTYRANDGVWFRRYSDGRSVQIVVPPNVRLIPIPFPIEHQ